MVGPPGKGRIVWGPPALGPRCSPPQLGEEDPVKRHDLIDLVDVLMAVVQLLAEAGFAPLGGDIG